MSDKLYPVSKEWAKRAHVDDGVFFGYPHPLAELTQRFRGVAPATHTLQRGQTWVVPALHEVLVN